MIIEAINRTQIEAYIPDITNIVAICIYSSSDVAPTLKEGWKDSLAIQFDDIDNINTHGLKLFNKEHANNVLSFIEQIKPSKVIINCDAGISRSVGIKVALEYIYNDNNIFNKYPLHNKYVASTMLKVWAGGEK